VHTGLAVVGNMGSQQAFRLHGDRRHGEPRLAARGREQGLRHQLLVSETTWARWPTATVLGREVGRIGVEGPQEPIRVYEPLASVREDAEPRSGPRKHAAAMATARRRSRPRRVPRSPPAAPTPGTTRCEAYLDASSPTRPGTASSGSTTSRWSARENSHLPPPLFSAAMTVATRALAVIRDPLSLLAADTCRRTQATP
jgi:hypothetical protein